MSGCGAPAGNADAICLSAWGGASMSPNRRRQDFIVEVLCRGGYTPLPHRVLQFFFGSPPPYSGLWSGELVVLLFLEL